MQDIEARTLLDVIKIIPDDCYRNPTATGLAYTARTFAIYIAIVAGILSTDTWWLLTPLIFACRNIGKRVVRHRSRCIARSTLLLSPSQQGRCSPRTASLGTR